jgi:hypothetical protein
MIIIVKKTDPEFRPPTDPAERPFRYVAASRSQRGCRA